MNYTIFLGPTNQAVPEELWEEFRERDLMFLWELKFHSYGPGKRMHTARLHRYNGSADDRKRTINVGTIIQSTRGGRHWNCFGARGDYSVDGFATRLAAAEYLLQAQGFSIRP